MRISDWSSDVCSSDLFGDGPGNEVLGRRQVTEARRCADVLALQAVEQLLLGPAHVALDQVAAGILVRFEPAAGDFAGIGRRVDRAQVRVERLPGGFDRVRSEEHTSELQSLMRISYAVFCLKKKTIQS